MSTPDAGSVPDSEFALLGSHGLGSPGCAAVLVLVLAFLVITVLMILWQVRERHPTKLFSTSVN